ncbi:MAG: hypothetical protein WC269_03830 [Candidatus Gracilibacteria bacterium]|jgi:tRNA (guanine10-N2)-dimethyltransferase
MSLYAFELGRKKEICLAELYSVLGKENLAEKTFDAAIFKLEALKNPQNLQNILGGTIKIIEIFDEVLPETDWSGTAPRKKITSKDLMISIKTNLNETFKGHEGKVNFSVSMLSFLYPRPNDIREILNYSKKILKSLGINSRFVNKNFENTKPSTIYKARVLEKGIDLCIIKGQKTLYLGRTVAIQDIDAYSDRDYEKPRRDAKIGMLPPKLAQVMINMVLGKKHNAEKETTPPIIYDPFSGTGTILTEGLLMGFDVVGSDIDQRLCEFSKENCEWLEKEFKTTNKFRIFQKDAQMITKQDLPEKIDAIITEGYLGTPQFRIPHPIEQQRTFKEISNLTFNWLKKAHELTPKHCKVILCLPAYKSIRQIAHLPHFEEIARKAGYKILEVFTYSREDQIVARDIKILEKL